MKRIIPVIIGLCIALQPQITAAQNTSCPDSAKARALLEKTPVGHYAQQVIERVDKGIERARGLPGGSRVFNAFSMHWMTSIESIMYMLIDTELHSVEYSRDLTQISACLHADLAIFEAKMEEIRCEIKDAFDRKSPAAISRLESISLFLNGRYKNLVRGALNTEHKDDVWQYWHLFDEPVGGWCCVRGPNECRFMQSSECVNGVDGVPANQFYPTRDTCLDNGVCTFANDANSTPPKYEPICPFDSNYLAPTFSGYGCDLSVLSQFSDLDDTSHQEEYDALDSLITTRDEFLEDTEHIRDSAIKMDDILDNTMLTDEQRAHLDQFGEAKVREIEHKHTYGCADVSDAIPEPEDEDTDGDNDPADKVRPSTLWATQELRGPFNFAKDHFSIWQQFFKLNLFWAGLREFPTYMRQPSEFIDEDDRKLSMEYSAFHVPRGYLRERWRRFMMGQAIQEAVILPKAQDMQRSIIEIMKPLRISMKNNIELVQDSSGGMRKFTIGDAYFLRRSCINRQCNPKLDMILKILFTDICFPYASGEFETSEDEEGSSNEKGTWERCKEEVEKL